MLEPLVFSPLYRSYVWGGRNLGRVLHRDLPADSLIAESWEVSDVGGAESIVESGRFAGRSLRELCREFPNELLGQGNDATLDPSKRFPLLVKYLDAEQVLSVQVHPDDHFAREHENGSLGKTEMWLIIEARGEAEVIAGLRTGVTREDFLAAARRGNLQPLLRRSKVEAGDVVLIPAGRVHAMGAGIVALEIQQTSDVTYRLYDWGRVGPDGAPRPLHLDRAIEVIDFSDEGRAVVQPVRRKENWGVWSLLGATIFFVTESFDRFRSVKLATTASGPDIVMAVNGPIEISWQGNAKLLPTGRTAVIPMGTGSYEIRSNGSTLAVRTRVPDRSDVLGDWTPRTPEESAAIRRVSDVR